MKQITLVGLVFLCGCATDYSYRKPGSTNQDFQHDKTSCLVKVQQAGVKRHKDRNEFIRSCMEGEGWTADQKQ